MVFYNGIEEQPAEHTFRLSDAFKQHVDEPDLELKVRVLNVNCGKNQELLNQCQALKEYAEYVNRVRLHQRSMGLSAAVERAVDECIREGILSDFLSKNRSEAIKVSILEYDEEKVLNAIRKDEFEQGMKKGRREGIREGEELGRREGEEIGKTISIKNLMESTSWSLEQAMDALKIPESERSKYKEEFTPQNN